MCIVLFNVHAKDSRRKTRVSELVWTEENIEEKDEDRMTERHM